MPSFPCVRALLTRARQEIRSPSAIYLVASTLGRVGSLFLLPLYARRLTAAEFGTYSLAQTLITLSPTLLSLGGGAALNKFYFAERDPKDGLRVTGTIGRWVLVVTALNGLLLWIPLHFIARHMNLLSPSQVACTVIAGVGITMIALPSAVLRCEERVYTAAGFQLGELLLSSGLGLLAVGYFGRGLDGAIGALAVTYAIGGVASALFFLIHARGPWDPRVARAAFRFSIAFVPHFLALWLQGVADRWTLKFAGDDAAVGAYSAAGQLSSPAGMVVTAWNLDRSTRNGAIVRDGGVAALRARMPSIVRGYLLAAAVPGVAILAAFPLLRLLVGPRLESGLIYLPVLLVVVAVDAAYNPYNHLVYYGGRARLIPMATAVAAATAVVANIVLVPMFGVPGALAARLLASLSRVGTMAFAARLTVATAAAAGAQSNDETNALP